MRCASKKTACGHDNQRDARCPLGPEGLHTSPHHLYVTALHGFTLPYPSFLFSLDSFPKCCKFFTHDNNCVLRIEISSQPGVQIYVRTPLPVASLCDRFHGFTSLLSSRMRVCKLGSRSLRTSYPYSNFNYESLSSSMKSCKMISVYVPRASNGRSTEQINA